MPVLVTGAAGFIGFHACKGFLKKGHRVTGIDNLNDYYDPSLKKARLKKLESFSRFRFQLLDISDKKNLTALFAKESFTYVVHLAAQAGVRYSLDNPDAYVQSNITGFANLLECCRVTPPAHLVFASSSSVYGLNGRLPFSSAQNVDHPASLYAASKKSNELMAHCYAHLFRIPMTGLRFFTVYGPWGRPDMALFLFTKAILEEKPLPVFNNGHMRRDFTFIDDTISGLLQITEKPAKPSLAWDPLTPDPASSSAPYAIYNIGNNKPIALLDFISCVEDVLGKKARLTLLPMQAGDVEETCAEIAPLQGITEFTPSTPLRTGMQAFVDWYKQYYS